MKTHNEDEPLLLCVYFLISELFMNLLIFFLFIYRITGVRGKIDTSNGLSECVMENTLKCINSTFQPIIRWIMISSFAVEAGP